MAEIATRTRSAPLAALARWRVIVLGQPSAATAASRPTADVTPENAPTAEAA